MSYEIYLEKFKIFYKEALEDLKIGAYNKTVSALWFSIEALLRGLLLKNSKNPPERSGKLINVATEILFHDAKDAARLSRLLTSLYYRRREIDHRKKIANRMYAELSLRKYNEALAIIMRKYPWIKQFLT